MLLISFELLDLSFHLTIRHLEILYLNVQRSHLLFSASAELLDDLCGQ